MAEKIGLIKSIKAGSWLAGTVNAFDICIVQLLDANGANWSMFLWNSRSDAPIVDRVLETQRLALAREAAVRKLKVHLWHQDDSSIVDQIQVDIP
jgi:hypothetical protein